ncbi:MAG: TonB-dependent receptor, partial [Pseudomonadota bacterium]
MSLARFRAAVPRASIFSLLGSGLVVSASLVSPDVVAEPAVIEEIVVTARKRAESIQDVPVAVSSIDKELKQANVRRLEDIQNFSPNLIIGRTPGIASGAAISIRGVSSSESDKSFDPAIGVMMDGMFLGTSSGVLLQNFDIERIEVLRGPQGTLFGKNTTGGIINVIRGVVTKEWGADISATAGDFGRQDFKAVVNMPLGDNAGLKLFGASIESDGYIKNRTLGRDVGGDDIQTYGFAALWEPTENLDIKIHYEKFLDDSEQGAYHNRNTPAELTCTLELIGLSAGANGCVGTTLDDEDHNSANGTNDSDNEYDTFIATLNYDLGDFLLTYIGTSRDMDEENNQHFDGAEADLLDMRFFNDWHQQSHELRVTSQFSDEFEFVAGLYYWDVDYEQRWDVGHLHYQLSRLGVVPIPLTPTTLSSNGQEQSTKSSAAFISADWHFAESWTLNAGMRWTKEEKDFIGGNGGVFYDPAVGDAIPALLTPAEFNDEWTEVTPKLGLRYQPNDNLMVYGSYSEGFKSGGFFGRQANFNIDPTYDPEYVDNYEVGFKSTLMEGRMILNGAVFLSDYEDKQESILVPVNLANVATVVRNAAVLELFGAELEMMFQINEAWFVRASYGYIDAEYDEYNADLNGDGIITDNSGLTSRRTPENTFGLTTN